MPLEAHVGSLSRLLLFRASGGHPQAEKPAAAPREMGSYDTCAGSPRDAGNVTQRDPGRWKRQWPGALGLMWGAGLSGNGSSHSYNTWIPSLGARSREPF